MNEIIRVFTKQYIRLVKRDLKRIKKRVNENNYSINDAYQLGKMEIEIMVMGDMLNE